MKEKLKFKNFKLLFVFEKKSTREISATESSVTRGCQVNCETYKALAEADGDGSVKVECCETSFCNRGTNIHQNQIIFLFSFMLIYYIL
jgi:hypothetical protein